MPSLDIEELRRALEEEKAQNGGVLPPEAEMLLQSIIDGRVEMAPSVEVERLAPYVTKVLEALDEADTWISDLATVGSFLDPDVDEDLAVARLSAALGVPIQGSDTIVEVAAKLRAKTAN